MFVEYKKIKQMRRVSKLLTMADSTQKLYIFYTQS